MVFLSTLFCRGPSEVDCAFPLLCSLLFTGWFFALLCCKEALMRLLRKERGLPWLSQDPSVYGWALPGWAFFSGKGSPFGQWLSQTRGISVSRCDMDRDMVSNIAGLCLTANLTAWVVWQELKVTMERQLHVQNQCWELGCWAPLLCCFSVLKSFSERLWPWLEAVWAEMEWGRSAQWQCTHLPFWLVLHMQG